MIVEKYDDLVGGRSNIYCRKIQLILILTTESATIMIIAIVLIMARSIFGVVMIQRTISSALVGYQAHRLVI
jgi:hypothetical protein